MAFWDDLQRMAQARDLASLQSRLEDALAQINVSHYTYHIVRAPDSAGPEAWYLTRYPQDWVDDYVRQGYVHDDPVLARAAQCYRPFQWRQMQGLVTRQRHVMEEASSRGLRDGFTIPLKSHGEFAALSLGFDLSSKDMGAWLHDHGALASLLGMYVHDAARDHFLAQPGRDRVKLTEREVECLRWTAAGKTSWEIGRILGISEKTVNIHIYNTMVKLNVDTRPQLVARAMWRGLLPDIG